MSTNRVLPDRGGGEAQRAHNPTDLQRTVSCRRRTCFLTNSPEVGITKSRQNTAAALPTHGSRRKSNRMLFAATSLEVLRQQCHSAGTQYPAAGNSTQHTVCESKARPSVLSHQSGAGSSVGGNWGTFRLTTNKEIVGGKTRRTVLTQKHT